MLYEVREKNLKTSVRGGGNISCFATGLEGLSCAVSFVDSPVWTRPFSGGMSQPRYTPQGARCAFSFAAKQRQWPSLC